MLSNYCSSLVSNYRYNGLRSLKNADIGSIFRLQRLRCNDSLFPHWPLISWPMRWRLVWQFKHLSWRSLSYILRTSLVAWFQLKRQPGYYYFSVIFFKSSFAMQDYSLNLSIPMLTSLGVAYGAVFILSLLGNVVVLLIVARNSHMRSMIDLFICNLSTADILSAICVLPMTFLQSVWSCKYLRNQYLSFKMLAMRETHISYSTFDFLSQTRRNLILFFFREEKGMADPLI